MKSLLSSSSLSLYNEKKIINKEMIIISYGNYSMLYNGKNPVKYIIDTMKLNSISTKILTPITSRVLRPSIRSCGHINISNTAATVPINMTHELQTNNVVS
ncbi:hypothetical protein DERP_000531 [Dermatophagoides pteronyssinus]|uniref:Uncharacterized protein n=1 Tax=Dermatophagoides pteronyssinus TaxID=6956 RepID=A0ABQ8J0H4_DERPT|nr:hypothetical protein DERP_000531 [Dermatophagoides pteronyssinus]